MSNQARGVPLLGRLLVLAVIGGLLWFGYQLVQGRRARVRGVASRSPATTPAAIPTPAVREPRTEVPTLAAAAPFKLGADSVVPIAIRASAGSAGLIAANGGLDPRPGSLFSRYCGCRVKLVVGEGDWSALNGGQLAAGVTTADVLAVYGREFHVKVPVQLDFSRGADGLVVRDDVRRVNGLRGRVVAAAQFTESDFFVRFLAQEAGIEVHPLAAVNAAPDSDRINVVYTDDGQAAGDLFLGDLQSGAGHLSGALTWEPKTTEVVTRSGGRARLLASNRNLLIIAEVLVVNEGFAARHPQMVQGIVRALLEGNRLVRDRPGSQADLVARSLHWSPEQARAELAKVQLANLPENLAFFNAPIDVAGSFGGIYQSAVDAYGSRLVKDPADPARFVDLGALQALDRAGYFKDQKVAIAPIQSADRGPVASDPLLSRDLRFFFEPGSAQLDLTQPANLKSLEAIRQLLRVGPGSTVLLRGHVDSSLAAKFRRDEGQVSDQQLALQAVELSRERVAEVQRLLVQRYGIDPKRIAIVGRGWEEPAGPDPDQNRRVEVQWFPLQ